MIGLEKYQVLDGLMVKWTEKIANATRQTSKRTAPLPDTITKLFNQSKERKRREKRMADDFLNNNYTEMMCTYTIARTCDFVYNFLVRSGEIKLDECSEPCSYNTWDVEIDSVGFPSTEAYFDAFIKDQVYVSPPPTYEYSKENMARLHIYYTALKEDVVQQQKVYEIQNFIAEFGGTVDIFIGFSFFTVFQLIEIGVAWIVVKCCRRAARGNMSEKSEPGPSKATVVANNAVNVSRSAGWQGA
eukprot:sb/3479455/